MVIIPSVFRGLALAGVGTLLWSAAAVAADTASLADARARFRQEMAVCDSGNSPQDLATCRLEARNALADASRGRLNDDPGQYSQNALRRCEVQKNEDRADCEMRMTGQGATEGSVAGGGVLRSSVTVVPAR